MRDGKLVAGQIGCGGFARDQDIPNLKGRGDVFVGYCCDASAEILRCNPSKRFSDSIKNNQKHYDSNCANQKVDELLLSIFARRIVITF